MKKILLSCALVLSVILLSVNVHAVKPASVEVLFMNHGPLMETLNKVKTVFSGYGDRVSVSWYDYDSPEGDEFMVKKGITQHIPLVIWIEGNPVVKVGQKEIKFVGFPTGAGPAFFQGKWTVEDLKAALDQTTAKK